MIMSLHTGCVHCVHLLRTLAQDAGTDLKAKQPRPKRHRQKMEIQSARSCRRREDVYLCKWMEVPWGRVKCQHQTASQTTDFK